MKRVRLKNQQEIFLREAILGDEKELHDRAFFESEFTLPHYNELNLTDIQSEQWLSARISHPNQTVIIAIQRDKIVGWIVFENANFLQRDHHGQIAMTVRKEWQNVGVGEALLNELIKWAEEHKKINIIYLTVLSHNERAIHLYKKLGFEITGKFPCYTRINNKYVDDIIMCKFLNKTLYSD